MRVNRVVRGFLCIVLLAGAWLPLSAQAPQGTIRGRVRSAAGAAVGTATVTVKNVETGESRTARTDAQGEFAVAGVEPGRYDLEAAAGEFVAQKRPGIEVTDGRPVVVEFVLEARAASGGGGTAVTRISEAQLVGLPLNGRSYSQLATLQAGIASTGGEQSSRGVGGGSLTVAGGRNASNNFLLDGTNIMDTFNQVPRSAAGVQLGSDAVYQVQVFATNYGAEYGRGSGGSLNSITRSGSNEFHVTLFEYFRNSKLDARNFFDSDPLNPAVRSDPPPFKRNQFGATLTGPIRKERTFWMAGFEAMRDRLSINDIEFFPDAAARQGTITDAAGNFRRQVSVSPKVSPYLALYPIPNLGSIGEGVGRHVATIFLPTTENYFIVRVDHKLSERDSLFARYVYDDASSIDNQAVFLFRTSTNSRQQYATLVESHIFNLTTVNAFRIGYTRPVNNIKSISSIPINPALYFVPNASQLGQIEIPGLPTFGPQFTSPEENILNSFQFADDVVAQRGKHTLKFGTDVHRYRWDVFNSHSKAGIWSFNSLDSFLQAGPDGTTLSVALPGSDNKKAFRQTLLALYVQDGYQVRPGLLLNLGLRYEYASLVTEKDGRLAILPDIVRDTAVKTGLPMLDHNPSKFSFSPRFSFSWSPTRNRNTVVSGGLGIYYDPLLEYLVDLQKNSFPYYRRAVSKPFNATGTFPDAVAAATEITFATPFQVEVLDYHHMKMQTVIRYNLTVQRTFAGGLRTQAAYVGARGNHLLRGYEANLYPIPIQRADGSLFFPPDSGPINPNFGGITISTSDAQSFYNALQVTANKSFGQGLTLQGNYTFSKSVDDASSSNSGISANISRQYPFMRTLDRGLSDFDIRHRLVVNYFYNLPIGRGRTWWKSGPLAAVFGGWRVGGISSFRSGTPFHPIINVRDSRFLFTATRPHVLPGQRPDVTEGISSCAGFAAQELGGPERYFDPCPYVVPELGTLGNAGRNIIRAPNIFSTDASLQKDFLLGGERRLQFRAEFFNVLNRTNLGGPGRGARVIYSGASRRPNANAGQITGTTTTSRQIQFALRLSF